MSVKDLKGRKFGYTNPRSTSQALATLVLQSGGLKTADVELVKTGGFGEGVAALDIGLIDIAPIPEPLWSRYHNKYRTIAKASELLPPIANVLGVAHANPAGKEGFIRAVIRARRKAVAFMTSNPDESGDIIAKVYNLEPEVARAVVKNLTGSRTGGVAYWGAGDIHMDGLNRAIEVQKMVGAISGDVDIAKIVDTRYLPDDLKALR
jgi:NitT/TauT family transport system substrate-binding protein